ncbi:uncharacterized protein LOC126808528 [Patella vulgata]|uniref:uncharacterized protein LOC126808528 n=1 Tax=Patella vulgata TaxID=6465 RepID=UPI00217F6546|nr:uncharacterized protein LOC126808528 [Patella vulgata]
MASRHKCSICFGDFVRPKIMPCFHTFCLTCLQHHITLTAHNGKINCSMCRTEINIPTGGAAGFTNNFYIEDRAGRNFCPKHEEMELKFYCRDCSVAICSDCIAVDHADHKRAELKTVDPELRQSLKTIKLEIENQIKLLNNQLEYLDEKSTDIEVFAKTSKDNVLKKVESICSEVRKLGKKINDKIDVLRVEESKKVEDLKAGINKDKTRLQTSVKCADDVFGDVSTIQVINILPHIETLAEDHSPIRFCNPVVKYFNFPQTKINPDSLTRLFGELHTMDSPTFTTCFNMDHMKEDQPYWSPDYYMVQDLPWHVGVYHDTDKSTLGIYLNLKNVQDTNVKSCTIKYTLKLINRIHESKSISKQGSQTFTPDGSSRGWVEFTDWNNIKCQPRGFTDNNNDFIVQATIEISKMCFTSCFDLKRADTDTNYRDNKLVMLQDLYWRAGVEHHHNQSTLGVYLDLKTEQEKNLTSCTADYKLKLVHGTDDSKSIEKQFTTTDTLYTPGGTGHGASDIIDWNTLQNTYGSIEFIDWNTLQNDVNGFLDNGHFTIDTTVEVTSSTFTHTFNLTDVPTDTSLYGDSHTIQYLPWRICVKHHTDKTSLGLYLHLYPGVDKTVKTCSTKYKLKLIHPTDQSQSKEDEIEYTFKPGSDGYGWPKFIDWDDFTRRFVDGNKFTVQATITITDIDRY